MNGLFPLLGGKHYSALVAQCGKEMVNKMDSLVANSKATSLQKKQNGAAVAVGSKQQSIKKNTTQVAVTAEQLLLLMDTTFASKTQIPRPIIKQLVDIFNKLKVVCTLPTISGSAKESCSLLQKILPKVSSTGTPTLNHQLASLFSLCLANSDACLSAWSAMLRRHLLQSAKILKLMAAEEESIKILAFPSTKKALQAMQQTTACLMADDSHAREFNKEVKRVLAALPVSGKGKGSSGTKGLGKRRQGLTTFGLMFRALFWGIVLTASIGYYCVSLDNNKQHFGKSWLGKIAASAGVEGQALGTVHSLAVLTNSTAK